MKALKPRHIDFYQSFFEKVPITRKEEQRIVSILVPILLVLVMGGCYGFLQLNIRTLNSQIAPVETYLNTIDTQTLHQLADTLQQENERLSVVVDNLVALDAAADSYPHLPQDMLAAVYSQANDKTNVVGLTYGGDTGILSISVETDRPESGQSYIEGLRRTGYFTAIAHTGYASSGAANSGSPISVIDADNPIYSIEIFATLPSPKEVQP